MPRRLRQAHPWPILTGWRCAAPAGEPSVSTAWAAFAATTGSLADPPGASVVVAAVAWIEGTLLGTVARASSIVVAPLTLRSSHNVPLSDQTRLPQSGAPDASAACLSDSYASATGYPPTRRPARCAPAITRARTLSSASRVSNDRIRLAIPVTIGVANDAPDARAGPRSSITPMSAPGATRSM
jgi:hypothetical protein